MDWKALNSRVADWKVQLYFKNLWNELSSLKFENVRVGGFNGLQKSMGWKAQFVEKMWAFQAQLLNRTWTLQPRVF